MLGNTDEEDTSPILFLYPFDGLFDALPQFDEEIAPKDLAPQQAVAHK
jgi:hypothetical protein